MLPRRGPSTDAQEFSRLLASSSRVLALCGAGLSAASGLETQAFRSDPGLVWLFYAYRRHKALQAAPNPGHHALAELARKMPGFITLTQNVDGEFVTSLLFEKVLCFFLCSIISFPSSQKASY
jgi:NAD-dependent deacetylase sirtuin 5